MSAFKVPGRPGYRIRPTLPEPWGRVGPWATGFNSRRQADTVEAWLQEMALTRPEVVDALVEGRFKLRDAWVAKLRGTLDEMVLGLTDPPIATGVAEFLPNVKDDRVRHGLCELAELADQVERERAEAQERRAPKSGSLRVSWLLVAKNVNALYAAALEDGRSANSVKRSVHRAVADLLAHQYGKVRRDEVMTEVEIPREEDERKVKVTSEDLGAVLRELDQDALDMAALAMLLAVDRGPLLRIAPRYFDVEAWTLEVLDTKTSKRPRTIKLSAPAWSILARRCAGRGLDERIFGYTEGQVRHLWEAARDRAAGRPTRNVRKYRGQLGDQSPPPDPVGEAAERLLAEQRIVTLPVLRFKDLRHLLPTAWNALGFSTADLQEVMGHARGSKETSRYVTPAGTREQMDKVAAYLGLDRLHLRASGE